MKSLSLDHMEVNDPMKVYIRRWEDFRNLERPPFARRMWKALEDSGEVHTCVEEYERKEIILDSLEISYKYMYMVGYSIIL